VRISESLPRLVRGRLSDAPGRTRPASLTPSESGKLGLGGLGLGNATEAAVLSDSGGELGGSHRSALRSAIRMAAAKLQRRSTWSG
jgi:hypothetical protein